MMVVVHAAGYYFGGVLHTVDDGRSLIYNAGNDSTNGSRSQQCLVDQYEKGNCDIYFPPQHLVWVKMTNLKAFLITTSGGTNSWSGRVEVVGYEVRNASSRSA